MPQFRKGSSSFGDNKEFSDVTLACEDGQFLLCQSITDTRQKNTKYKAGQSAQRWKNVHTKHNEHCNICSNTVQFSISESGRSLGAKKMVKRVKHQKCLCVCGVSNLKVEISSKSVKGDNCRNDSTERFSIARYWSYSQGTYFCLAWLIRKDEILLQLSWLHIWVNWGLQGVPRRI